jgi:hypothetical protein
MTTANARSVLVVAPGRPMARRLKAAEMAHLEAFIGLHRALDAREAASRKFDAPHSAWYYDREVAAAEARLSKADAALAAVRDAASRRLSR